MSGLYEDLRRLTGVVGEAGELLGRKKGVTDATGYLKECKVRGSRVVCCNNN